MLLSRLLSSSGLVALSVVLLAASSRAPAATTTESDAAVLIAQGEQQQKAGQLATALELYRAALLLAPNSAKAHRLAASALIGLRRCPEAIAELHAYLGLASAAEKRAPEYAQAVLGLARCLEEAHATITLVPSAPARCTVDESPAVSASPAAPASFSVVPGTHAASCETVGGLPVSESVTVAARETRRIDLALGAKVAFASRPPATTTGAATVATIGATSLPPPPVPAPAIPAPPAVAPTPSLPAPAVVASPPSIPAPVVPPPAVAVPPAAAAGASTAATGADSLRSTASPAGGSNTTNPPAAAATGEIHLQARGAGWTCRVDTGAPVAFDAADRAVARVEPGKHVVDCDRPGSRHMQARLSVSAGEERVVDIKPFPATQPAALRAARPEPVGVSAPASAVTGSAPGIKRAVAPGEPAPRARRWELRFALGFGPSLGVFGVGAGGRYGPFELMLGTGLNPFAASGTYYFRPGGSGFYLSAGYVRVGTGLLARARETGGNGFWASGGYDLRAEPHLAFRIGIGGGYNTTGLGTGPFVLDFSAAYVP